APTIKKRPVSSNYGTRNRRRQSSIHRHPSDQPRQGLETDNTREPADSDTEEEEEQDIETRINNITTDLHTLKDAIEESQDRFDTIDNRFSSMDNTLKDIVHLLQRTPSLHGPSISALIAPPLTISSISGSSLH